MKKEKRENVVHKDDLVSLALRETKEETDLLVQLVHQGLLVYQVPSVKRVTKVPWVQLVLREMKVLLVLQVHLVLLARD